MNEKKSKKRRRPSLKQYERMGDLLTIEYLQLTINELKADQKRRRELARLAKKRPINYVR